MADGGLDFGWYCREHAFSTQVLAALLGLDCTIVRGDFIVSVHGDKRLSSLGSDSGHYWCSCTSTPVIDLSLHFRAFGDGPQLAEPIVKEGRNGTFDVRLLPADTPPTAPFDTSIIGYIPRQQFTWSALEVIREPDRLLPTREAGEISARVALHTYAVMHRAAISFVGILEQDEALARLRANYPDSLSRLEELLSLRSC